MAKNRRTSRSQRPSPAGGGGFLRGLLLGLVAAVGVHLYHAGPPDWLGGTEKRAGGGAPAGTGGQPEPPPAHFDFYRLLPEKVVRVDDLPAGDGAPPPRPAPARSDPVRTSPPASREPAPGAPAASPRASGYRLQVGAFRESREADRLRALLALEGVESLVQTRTTATGTWHRVILGPYPDQQSAEREKARVQAARGIEARIVQEGG